MGLSHNGILHFADPDSPLSLELQIAPWPPNYKPVSLPEGPKWPTRGGE
jgi:hypothetical protein